MTKIIYKNMDKSDALHNQILTALKNYNMSELGIHITIEKENRTYHIKASTNRYVVSKRDYDIYALADKVVLTLKQQIEDYELRKKKQHKKKRVENEPDKELQKIKKFIIKPMTQENAIEHMRLLGHMFYIYINIEGKTELLFQKDDAIFVQTSFERSSLEDAIIKVFDENIDYYPFINEENEVVTIAYRRKNGEIGLIDAEI